MVDQVIRRNTIKLNDPIDVMQLFICFCTQKFPSDGVILRLKNDLNISTKSFEVARVPNGSRASYCDTISQGRGDATGVTKVSCSLPISKNDLLPFQTPFA